MRQYRLPNKIELKDYASYCKLVADAYDTAPVFDPEAVPAWESLATHTRKMFKQLLSDIDVEFVDYDPYAFSDPAAAMRAMRKDVEETGVLKVSTLHSEHPVWDLETNVQFRAVHDALFHLTSEARKFNARGEILLYNTHLKMLPKKAWPALFTEVVGQVCYQTTYGEFPVQKVAILHGFDYEHVGRVAGYEIEDKALKAAEDTRVDWASENEYGEPDFYLDGQYFRSYVQAMIYLESLGFSIKHARDYLDVLVKDFANRS